MPDEDFNVAEATSAELDEFCKFTFNDKVTLPSASYGPGYLLEFRDLVLAAEPPVNNVLEWGTGHTTILLGQYLKSRKDHLLVGIDDYAPFAKMIAEAVSHGANFKSYVCSRMGLSRSQRDPELHYASFPVSFGQIFDFVFIDGRRRMECALHALLLAKPTATIVIHDFKRARYQAILSIFDLVQETRQFRVFRPNAVIQNEALASARRNGMVFPRLIDGVSVKIIRDGPIAGV